MKAENEQIGTYYDYTNSSGADIDGGMPIQYAGRVAVTPEKIPNTKTKAVQVAGVIRGRNAAVAGNAGDNVWWDADGDPVSGTAGTGAFTTVAANGDFWVGTLERALAATDVWCYVQLNVANPALPAWGDRVHETKSANYTIDAEDVGKVLHIDSDAKVITLPATAAGIDVIFVNDGADGAVAVNLSPNANDKIMGPDVAGTDNKDQINTKGTAKRGDWMHLVADGSAGWMIVGKRGTWAEEA